jgi:AhpD family alkylhydroperoxidase
MTTAFTDPAVADSASSLDNATGSGSGATAIDDASLHPAGSTSTPARAPGKAKRTLTPGNFLRSVGRVLASAPALLKAPIRPTISTALREKLFLAVTAINDCRYCKWGHTHWALAQGVPLEEVNQILGYQSESLAAKDPAEAAAILFAQHYAEQLDRIDPEAVENLRKYFNDSQVSEILAYIRFITLTNLTGNTVDAVFDRVRGRGQPISLFEGVVGTAAAPVALGLLLLAKFDPRGGMAGLPARQAPHGRDQ